MHLNSKAIHAAKTLSAAMDDLPRSTRSLFWRIPSKSVIALHEYYVADTYGELRDIRSILGAIYDSKEMLRAYAEHHQRVKDVLTNRSKDNDSTAEDLFTTLRRNGFKPKLANGATAQRFAGILDVLRDWNSQKSPHLTLNISNLERVHALRMAYNEPHLIPRIIDVLNSNTDYGDVTITPEVFVMTVNTTGALQDGVL